MPTKHGTIWAQYVGFSVVHPGNSHTIQVNPNNRDITTCSAISQISAGRKSHFAECGVWRIVSNGLLEEFDPPLPRIQRDNVTSITFRTRTSECTVHGQHQINYWE